MTPEEHITIKPQVDEQVAPAEAPVKELYLNDVPVHNNEEISINYIHEGIIWDRNTTHINGAFIVYKLFLNSIFTTHIFLKYIIESTYQNSIFITLSLEAIDAFIDSTKVIKSHIMAANIPARIEIPTGKLQSSLTNEPKPRLKRGRPIHNT